MSTPPPPPSNFEDDFGEFDGTGTGQETNLKQQQQQQQQGQGQTHDFDENANFEKKIPSLKMKTTNKQTLKFSFCFSCGYRNMFEQYSQMISARFPGIKIIGENYAPSQSRIFIAQFIGAFKMVLIGLILFTFNPFDYVNMPTPALYNWAKENKLYACLMTFFLSNAIETQLITSGAFEIYLNDIQIWSKLQSDRMPHEKELMQILDMNFNFEAQKASAFG